LLRPTTIEIGKSWKKKLEKKLNVVNDFYDTLDVKLQEQERNNAYLLIDSLTKSGSLPFYQSSFHVILASTHCFDQTLMDTVIKDNINPIESLERSTLIVTTTIQKKESEVLVNNHYYNETLKM
jgi:hypothetical protein